MKRYIYYSIRNFLVIIYKFGNPNLSCKLQTFFLLLCGSKLRFYYDKHNKIYRACEGKVIKYFKNQQRGFAMYGYSLFKRGKLLFKSYCLQHIKFHKNDIVIDCGANYADLFLELKNKILIKNNYVMIDLNGPAYRALYKNENK
ncbi:hypothetical protein MCEMKE138_00234 [Candidatus Pelagibacterales bacterium]